MKKIWLGALTIATLSLYADSFRESDGLLAGKDFPFPPDESDLPENDEPSDDTPVTPPPSKPQSQKSGKQITPQVSKPKAGKDIFPPEDAD